LGELLQRILIVDDDLVQLKLTSEVARKSGFEPLTAESGAAALRLLRADRTIAAIILDLVMPDLDGLAVMEAMKREGFTAPVIVQTVSSSPEMIATATQNGAVDFFIKPVAPERLIVSLRNALRLEALETIVVSEQSRRTGRLGLADIVTRSPAMHRALTLIQKAAKSTTPILLEGETGTGKQLAARIIHGLGERAGKPFVLADCTRLDFVDAVTEAEGGTLLLRNIGMLAAPAQAQLLQMIEKGTIARAGQPRPERVNVRIIAATTERLLNLTLAGRVREDLFYRLNVLPIYLPPLRDRPDDIEPLAARFATRFAAEMGKRIAGPSSASLALLAQQNWPGNIRQLESTLYRAVALSEGDRLEPSEFPQLVARSLGRAAALQMLEAVPAPSAPVHIDAARPRPIETEAREAMPDRFLGAKGEIAPLEDVERDLIAFALDHYEGRMSQIARALKIGRSTLYRKLREYGFDDAIRNDAA
jgi:DNA-binding NtrC family response regulator